MELMPTVAVFKSLSVAIFMGVLFIWFVVHKIVYRIKRNRELMRGGGKP